MKKFVESYTRDELDAGTRMNFHPVTGESLTNLLFVESLHQYVRRVPCGGWDQDPDWYNQGRISAGSGKSEGELLPDHWKFDPWTGEELVLSLVTTGGEI